MKMITEGQIIPGIGKITLVKKLEGYGSTNFFVSNEQDDQFLIKIYPREDLKYIEEEIRIIDLLKSLPFNLPHKKGDLIYSFPDKDHFLRVSEFTSGHPLHQNTLTEINLKSITESAALMVSKISSITSDIYAAKIHEWNLRDAFLVFPKQKFIKEPRKAKIVNHYFDEFRKIYFDKYLVLRQGLIHGDLNEANIIIENGEFKGFIDFGDMSYGPVIGELAILMTYLLMMFHDDCISYAKKIVRHFHSKFPLTEDELEILPLLIAVRLCVSVCNSAEKKHHGGATEYILISEKPAWALLEKWMGINPVLLINSFKEAAGMSITVADSNSALERRKKISSPSLSLSYMSPIHMSGALFQYMYDAGGNTYLDAYNNIPHVGHCHPAVVKAACDQMSRLNTNTRYLYDIYNEYAELLLSYFPSSLDKVMLVNSGSEASDLATRIARTVSSKKGIAIVQWSYHGNTQNGINISSYKFDRKGGKGPDDCILTLPLPKAFNGTHTTAEGYVNEAIALIEQFEIEKHPLAAFIAEPISGCGGQVPLMKEYLPLLTRYLKKKGIYIIIDEVQTGFGRLGKWFWGFEMHGIEPDFVVLGKPMGNGHPMGGVVTRTDILDAFNNGMEFFSSFGGNPVSCATGKAVLETIRDENLQQNALNTGQYWKDELFKIAKKYTQFADIRGEGLFLGVECLDHRGKEDTLFANKIKNELRDKFILASTDGPQDNVLKMKPPICFSKDNVDQFCGTIESILKKF